MYIIIYYFDYNNYHILGYVETEDEAKKNIETIKKLAPKNPFTSFDQQYAFEKILENEWSIVEEEIEDDYWTNVAPEGYEDSTIIFNKANAILQKNIMQTRYNWFKKYHSGFAKYIEPYFAWKRYYYNDLSAFSYKRIDKFNLFNSNI